MAQYTTGEIAKLCGVSVRTVQYYDNRGILSPTELSEGGRRLYSEDDLKQLKVICYLRELDLPLDTIGRLMRDQNAGEVIPLILEEQAKLLKAEISEKEEKLKKLENLYQLLGKQEQPSLESIGDMTRIMADKKKMNRLHINLVLFSLPVTILEWTSVLLWILKGIWWPFLGFIVLDVLFAIWISAYYFKRISFICPKCHGIFSVKARSAFWSNHTPTTRKLTCTHCGHKGFCVEIYRRES